MVTKAPRCRSLWFQVWGKLQTYRPHWFDMENNAHDSIHNQNYWAQGIRLLPNPNGINEYEMTSSEPSTIMLRHILFYILLLKSLHQPSKHPHLLYIYPSVRSIPTHHVSVYHLIHPVNHIMAVCVEGMATACSLPDALLELPCQGQQVKLILKNWILLPILDVIDCFVLLYYDVSSYSDNLTSNPRDRDTSYVFVCNKSQVQ